MPRRDWTDVREEDTSHGKSCGRRDQHLEETGQKCLRWSDVCGEVLLPAVLFSAWAACCPPSEPP